MLQDTDYLQALKQLGLIGFLITELMKRFITAQILPRDSKRERGRTECTGYAKQETLKISSMTLLKTNLSMMTRRQKDRYTRY